MDEHRTNGRRSWLMLASYIPVHAAPDIIVLNNFDVPESSIYFVFVANVVLAFAIVWLIFWAFDRLRPRHEEATSEP